MVKSIKRQTEEAIAANRKEINDNFQDAMIAGTDNVVRRSPQKTGLFVGSLEVTTDKKGPQRKLGDVKGKRSAKAALRKDVKQLDLFDTKQVFVVSHDSSGKVDSIEDDHDLFTGMRTVVVNRLKNDS